MAELRKVNVIGHQRPDTDSICSAIAYTYLKNTVDKPIYEARRAGAVSRETAFVLKHFGFEEPNLITTVTPQIKDSVIERQPGISGEMSLAEAWKTIQESAVDTLCIVNGQNKIEGLVAVKDIARANMDVFDHGNLGRAHTRIANVVSTLSGTLLVGDANGVVAEGGRVRVGTSPEMMSDSVTKGDIVLVTNRKEVQQFALEAGASCIIICCGADLNDEVRAAAEKNHVTIIATPYDTYEAARLINMSLPVRAKMLPEEKILRFSVDTAIDDAKKTMATARHRFYPVVNEDGTYAGLTSSPMLLKVTKKHVILVDHNERGQAVDGIEQADILEIIDHHRVGSVETNGPIYFRNMPVGCTSTILYGMYREFGVEIPKNIAGLMLSAILSDTLTFRSPTCTQTDIDAAHALAKICGEDIDAYSNAMFEAGSDLTGRSADEVFNADFKVFSRGNAKFGVGQGFYMTENSRKKAMELVGPYLEQAAKAQELPMIFYLFTDVPSQTSEVIIYGNGAAAALKRAFDVEAHDNVATLEGVVSRKKQVVPPLMAALQTVSED